MNKTDGASGVDDCRSVGLRSVSYSLIARNRRVGRRNDQTDGCRSCCVLDTSLHNADAGDKSESPASQGQIQREVLKYWDDFDRQETSLAFIAPVDKSRDGT